MNRLRYAVLTLTSLLTASCNTQHSSSYQMANNFLKAQTVEYKAAEFYPKKNPTGIHFYSMSHEPIAPYKIIGVAKISKFNLLGVKRNPSQLNEMMKKLAAEIGGDGILNLEEQPTHVKANIIAYQKILL